MPLLRPKQSLHRSVRRRGTGRPPGLDQSSNGPPCLPREGPAPSRPINLVALITRRKMGRHGGHPSLKNDLDLGGLQSLAAAESIKALTIDTSRLYTIPRKSRASKSSSN